MMLFDIRAFDKINENDETHGVSGGNEKFGSIAKNMYSRAN